MDVLTYDEIREIERKEKENKNLVKLSLELFNRYNDYLADKRKVIEKDDDNLIASKMKKQSTKELKNARESFNKIFNLRARKLIDQAFIDLKMGTSLDDKNLFVFEKQFYDSFKSLLLNHLQSVNKRKIKKEDGVKNVSKNNLTARFVKDLPSFVWEGKVLGPFKKEDVVNLPKNVVQLLLNKKALEVID